MANNGTPGTPGPETEKSGSRRPKGILSQKRNPFN